MSARFDTVADLGANLFPIINLPRGDQPREAFAETVEWVDHLRIRIAGMVQSADVGLETEAEAVGFTVAKDELERLYLVG